MSGEAVQVHVVGHPVVQARLTAMRDERTSNDRFRELLSRLARMLVYEALADAPVSAVEITTPIGPCQGTALGKPPLLVPVLRAGLGMLDAALAMVPEAGIGFVGVARNEETTLPDEYLISLPDDLSDQPVIILEPMLATGGSMLHTLDVLARRGATDVTAVCVVAAPQGIEALRKSGHRIRLVLAALDDGLDERSYIVPGLGDAGDRLYGVVG